jgi:hypothetical protein
MTALGPSDLIRSARRRAFVAAPTPAAAATAAPTRPPVPAKARPCGLFTLADAKILPGSQGTADPSQSPTVNFGGQRDTQCAHSAGSSELADAQMSIPLNAPRAQQRQTAFENGERAYRRASVQGLGAASFGKSKVGTPAIYLLTAGAAAVALGATTNGTNSASQTKPEQGAGAIVKALG